MHMMGRERGKVVVSIHKEVIIKIKTETKLNMEGNESKREVMILCK